MIQIKHRCTGAVLFECKAQNMRDAVEHAVKTGADLSGANLAGTDLANTDLAGAYLAFANLAGANLAFANLAGANLANANMAGVKWRDDVIINRAPLQVHGLRWAVTILDQHMQIGCQLHTLAEWGAFDDAAIIAMDGRSALRFWRATKTALLALAHADGRGVAA